MAVHFITMHKLLAVLQRISSEKCRLSRGLLYIRVNTAYKELK
jgi:hypothetical protein